jgi:hypothetical protein
MLQLWQSAARKLLMNGCLPFLGDVRGAVCPSLATCEAPFALLGRRARRFYNGTHSFFGNLGPVAHLENTLPNRLVGFQAGAGSAWLSTPIDVVKTRLQVVGATHTSAIAQFKDIAQNEGSAAFFKGALPRMSIIGTTRSELSCMRELPILPNLSHQLHL